MFRKRFELSPIGLDVAGGGARAAAAPTGSGAAVGGGWGDGRCIRAAQLAFDRRDPSAPPRIAALARLARPRPATPGSDDAASPAADLSPGFLASMLGALARQGFVGDEVVLHVPQRSLLSAALDVPPRTSGAPLDLICRNELARNHRIEPDQIESGWWELPPPPSGVGMGGGGVGGRDAEGTGAQAMAVGCRVADAEELIAAFDAAGAHVRAIDARGPALARACRARVLGAPALTAVLEWEFEAAMIVILRGQTVVYERFLPEAGLAFIHAAIGRKLGLDGDVTHHLLHRLGLSTPGTELAEDPELISQAQRLLGEHLDSMSLELRASASYAGRRFGEAVGRILFCGEGAAVPAAAARLGRQLESALEVLEPGLLFPGDAGSPEASGISRVAQPAALTVALGLAAFPTEDLA